MTLFSHLVALYDIRPGNGAGIFLQSWNLTGQNRAREKEKHTIEQ